MVGKLAVFIVVAMSFSFSPPPAKVVLFFGDSLTAGYGLNPEDAFPAVVDKTLKKSGVEVRVINAGLSGETSAGGLTRIDWILRQPIDVFFLELGANDGLRGLPLSETRKNLQTIIDKVKVKNPKCRIVLAGMMVPPNMGKEYSDEFRVLYSEIARKNKATLIPFLLDGVAGIERLNQADGIHPTAEGHAIIGKNITEVILPMVK
ncbi:MAG: arylesterase [Cyclobacteriaceae bacterium]|nr:arylesterase [Cyclobacteriaceae bacterium]